MVTHLCGTVVNAKTGELTRVGDWSIPAQRRCGRIPRLTDDEIYALESLNAELLAVCRCAANACGMDKGDIEDLENAARAAITKAEAAR
jgi:hypothetical protein